MLVKYCYTPICLICISVFMLIMPFHAVSAQKDRCVASAFYIAGIDVSVEAATSEEARAKASELGLNQAWSQLKARILLAEQPLDSDDNATVLRDLLDYTRIDQETVLPSRYIGRLDYCFDRAKTREFFTGQSLRYAELRSGRMLILPVWNAQLQAQLWKQPNPWAQAWAGQLQGRDGLVDLALAESLSIERAVDVEPVLSADRATIAKAAKIEKAERVIITTLTPTVNDGDILLAVTANLYDRNGKFESTVYKIDDLTMSIDQVKSTLDWLAGDMAKGIENVWRSANEVNVKDGGVLMLNVPANSIKEWSKHIDILSSLAPVEKLSVVQLSARGGIVKLDMAGTLQSLNYALESHLLKLEESRNNDSEIPLTLRPLNN